MHQYLTAAGNGLYWLVFPVYWLMYNILYGLLQVALFILLPLLAVLEFLAQPLFLIGSIIARCFYLPFEIAKRLETVYIYLGVGGIVGISTGLILHQVFRSTVSALNLKHIPEHDGLTVKDHREARLRKAQPAYGSPPQILQPQPGPRYQSNGKPVDKPSKVNRSRLSALPSLTIQGPSPDGKRSLLEQTLDEDMDSDP